MHFHKIILILLLVAELLYSFVQYQQQTIDGDLIPIVLPTQNYQPVLEQPFGFAAISAGEKHAGINRFSFHFSMHHYFRAVPLFLQNFVSPIESVYLAASLFKIAVHIAILWLLAAYASGSVSPIRQDFLLAAVLIAPLFQTTQFNLYMGLISPAVTYTFAYGFPFALLLLFFLPFYQEVMGQAQLINKWTFFPILTWSFLAVFLAFSSPIMSPVVVLICGMLLLYFWYKNFNKTSSSLVFYKKTIYAIQAIPPHILALFSFFILWSLYSLYLGTFNIESDTTVGIIDRYIRLGKGVIGQLTSKLAFPLFMIFLGLNYFLIQQKTSEANPKNKLELNNKINLLFKWVSLFSLIYLLLLPLGGFREYRPKIIRSDTLIPVLLVLYFLFGISSLYILNHFSGIKKKYYAASILVLLSFFTISDEPNFGKNVCEKEALQQIANSDYSLVLLEFDCTIMSWTKTTRPKHSKHTSELLFYWNIITEKRLFYQETNK